MLVDGECWMVDGGWWMVDGGWWMGNGRWQMVNGKWKSQGHCVGRRTIEGGQIRPGETCGVTLKEGNFGQLKLVGSSCAAEMIRKYERAESSQHSALKRMRGNSSDA
jgi:hypothetical protein